jgi:hypothetical protein
MTTTEKPSPQQISRDCPSCGSHEAEVMSSVTATSRLEFGPPYFVLCECDSRTRFFETKEGAINAWNDGMILRPNDDPDAQYCSKCHGIGMLDKPADYECEDCIFFGQDTCTCDYCEVCSVCGGVGLVPKS